MASGETPNLNIGRSCLWQPFYISKHSQCPGRWAGLIPRSVRQGHSDGFYPCSLPHPACVGGHICVLSGSIKSLHTAHEAALETRCVSSNCQESSLKPLCLVEGPAGCSCPLLWLSGFLRHAVLEPTPLASCKGKLVA